MLLREGFGVIARNADLRKLAVAPLLISAGVLFLVWILAVGLGGGALGNWIGSVLPWLAQAAPISFGPAPTAFGAVTVEIVPEPPDSPGTPRVSWHGEWHRAAPPIEIRLPGFVPVRAAAGMAATTLVARGA